MIEAHGVSKHYGEVAALEDVSLQINKGEIVGLLGPNGAGKTTLIRVLTGYFEPSGGQVLVDGTDIESDSIGVQSCIGYLPESTPLYPEMLVQEYLDMVADFREMSLEERPRLIAEAVVATGLRDHLTHPIGSLSKGFRQRVGLAQAILHKPKVLILDEPTSGLDPTQVVQVRDLIKKLAQESTVLFSTHILSEVEQVCERAIILLGGKVKADARLCELRDSHSAVVGIAEEEPGSGVPMRVEGADGLQDARGIVEILQGLKGASSARQIPGRDGYLTFEVESSSDADICRQVYRAAQSRSWELGELRPVFRDLETVFRDLVREHDGAKEPQESSDSEMTGESAAPEVSP